ncbi:MAG: Protein of unknown function DUF1592/DUF1588/DUF1587/DUF1595/DUF1585/Planctomycete cytochrome C [Verrucomicrobia bacterium]|nr:MAG: Protein of unknown function DUF1592/DUF1588/DUF1587/DUF1595/DUF1585/Planctomycete cytochrome C [Verrucomicrobiota bacterium]
MHRILSALIALVGGLRAAEPPAQWQPFLDQHCVECHDADVTKGGLNLLDLAFEPKRPQNLAIWQRVVERVHHGEMPPAKEPRPDPDQAKAFVAALTKPLLEADRADLAENGRVRTRRLTRLEYEHSLHDLLGIDIPLVGLLPEDPETNGFETVASGQQLSYHQLARYLDVADIALNEAFTRAIKGNADFKVFLTPEQLAKKGTGNYRGPDLRDGKSISWPITLQFFGRMRATEVPASGWYRITLRDVEAIHPGKDGAVWGTMRSGTCDSNAPLLSMVGLVEATSKPQDLVYQAWIEKGHQLELKPNDATLKRAQTGAQGGNVSFEGRDLEKDGFSGIAHRGIQIERVYPNAKRSAVREKLFGSDDLAKWDSDPAAGVDALIARFARRVFRRPETPEQIAPYRDLALAALRAGDPLPDALKAGYRAILCSPRFLTFVEAPGKLDDHAIATRLSYCLWVSPPDAKLLELAAAGKLTEPNVLATEIDRLLADRKSQRFIESFTGQWLKLKQIDFTAPDPRQFKTFDPVLQESFVLETRAYLNELIRSNRDIAHLVDSGFVFLNGRLARHYDLDLPLKAGAGLQKVSLPDDSKSVRGGLVTQGAILKVTADGTHTSPVVRGVFVNERILGVRVPPPPPGVPAIEPDIRGAISIRDQLDKHRNNESCASCHQIIDPPGFALENFDPIGGWRTRYGENGKGVKIDATGVTPEGETFESVRSWKSHYRKREGELALGFARQFLTYAAGAPSRFSDAEFLDAIVKEAAEENYGIRSLIRACLTSPIFLTK